MSDTINGHLLIISSAQNYGGGEKSAPKLFFEFKLAFRICS